MGSLKEVRNRIVSVKSTQQITRAMKVVSAAKLRKAQQRIVQMRPYAVKLQELLSNLSSSLEGSDAVKYYDTRPVQRVLVVVVTSDRGLAGSFNSAIVKETYRTIAAKYGQQVAANGVDLIAVGKKGFDLLRKSKYTIIQEHLTLFNNLAYEDVEAIANFVMNAFVNKEYDAVEIVYNRFKNAAVYNTTVETFLPIQVNQEEDHKKGQKNFEVDYIFEPSKEEIVSQLILQSLKVNFYRTLLESNAAEHGARMTAMDKATENAEDLLKALKLAYNKERQATITKEILEIVGGAQALNG